MKKGVTIKDIAKKLHMSVSTVSKALNNDPSISALTSERVKALAQELNYVPNEAARHFKLSRTFTLGLIIPDILDQYYAFAINGVEAVAEQRGYHVILSQSHEDVATEQKIVDVMVRHRVDGVIVSVTKNTVDMQPFRKLLQMGIPVVCIGREPKGGMFDFVTSDNHEGGFAATDFLIKKGHRHIAHLMGPEGMRTSHARYEGYKAALEANGIPFREELVKAVDLTPEGTYRAMEELLQLAEPPTGIFTFKNYITLEALHYLKTQRPELLEKIGFTGFGNLPILHYLDHKPLASIEESSFEIGEEAARILFERMSEKDEEEPTQYHSRQLPCRLVVHDHL
ncbi:LacI family transcriptional regulator [Chitinophaga lutea]|uniref:LacI family transcriptional regulator n=1 Tax=Chitinophaga lutea TaxID=2488634 RepID=A0A3N4PP66_9BACT|nr:LacI family DNA-binding transcriptional regulator [Chitinophaga lutea]RPE08459.1 LacI family transcriptional regulator [Chitinophaga lutea]